MADPVFTSRAAFENWHTAANMNIARLSRRGANKAVDKARDRVARIREAHAHLLTPESDPDANQR